MKIRQSKIKLLDYTDLKKPGSQAARPLMNRKVNSSITNRNIQKAFYQNFKLKCFLKFLEINS